ncbi:MAG: hypothetical protein HRT67_10735 [Flavobacteriaceae bacterium]|nr:hypothetical protein [Flavobacteriaceae bacterium]
MKDNTGIILTLAYPETIVRVAKEWYSPYLRYFGIGKKNYVRAGHAAMVLIDKGTGVLEYYDFGRYITSVPNGRVRGKITDHELNFPLQADIVDGEIVNLNEVLKFLATHPKLTHGEGKMIASVCNEVHYQRARNKVLEMQKQQFIRYAAFKKKASNCARFVASVLIAGVTNENIRKKLLKSTRFTPSTIGNVAIAGVNNRVYEVSGKGVISEFKSTVSKENRRLFLDRLKNHQPNLEGNLEPRAVSHVAAHAQWLSGVAAGAWFELYVTDVNMHYRFRRISPYGNVDVDGVYKIDQSHFDYSLDYEFVHYSNCQFYHVRQNDKMFRFDLVEKIN